MRSRAVGRRERRELRLAKRKIEIASLGNFVGMAQPVWMFLCTPPTISAGARKWKRSAPPLSPDVPRRKSVSVRMLCTMSIFLPVFGRGVVDGRARHGRKACRSAFARDQP